MLKLVEMLAAVILLATMLAIVAIAMGFLPSSMGRAGAAMAESHSPICRRTLDPRVRHAWQTARATSKSRQALGGGQSNREAAAG